MTLHAQGIAIRDGQKVAFLGDSITRQGWDNPGGYVRLVVAGLAAEGIHIAPIPAGVSGDTSKEMLHRLDDDVLSQKPDWLLVSCGVNDVWHGANGVALPLYGERMTSIIDETMAKGIRVLILTATGIGEDTNPYNQALAPYNDFLRTLAQHEGCPLADVNAAFQSALKANPPPPGTFLLTIDGVHLNPAGNRLMAREILRALGVPEADFPKIEAAWATLPGTASVSAGLKGTLIQLNLGQYQALEVKAAKEKTNVNGLTEKWYLETLRTILKTHANDPAPNPAQIEAEAQQQFAQRITEAVKADTNP